MSSKRLIGPWVILSIVQSTVPILQEFFIPEVRKMKKMRFIVFQHDGAPLHFAADVRRFLNKTFSGKWIGRGGPMRWASLSSDLTPLNFFLWEHIKNGVYLSSCEDLAELKSRIHDEIKSISQKILLEVFGNISKRMNLCVSVDGGHFEHLLSMS